MRIKFELTDVRWGDVNIGTHSQLVHLDFLCNILRSLNLLKRGIVRSESINYFLMQKYILN